MTACSLSSRMLLCPKCALPMTLWESADLEIDHGHTCKGLWFDAGGLESYLARSQARLDESQLAPVGETPLSCPRCPGIRLGRAHVDTVPIDICPRCRGIFVDLGEMHALLGAVSRSAYADDPALSRLDNQALGLYIAARLEESGLATATARRNSGTAGPSAREA
jgi:Zn-finger nucleic acid-binding protein